MTSNQEKLVNAFAESLAIDKAMIKDELAYRSIPQWDSISHMIIISALEEAFDVTLDTDDVIDMSSVGKAKEILGKYEVTF